MNPLTSINGKATVLSPAAFLSRHPSGKISRGSRDDGKVFVCCRGCNTRTATYTQEFVWEDLYQGREDDVYDLIKKVQSETKSTRKRRGDDKGQRARSTDRVVFDEPSSV